MSQFEKGKSGNKSGRPKGFAGMAKLIAALTRDGAELVEFAISMMRDPNARPADRLAAQAWLADRGFGRPIPIPRASRTPEPTATAPVTTSAPDPDPEPVPDPVEPTPVEPSPTRQTITVELPFDIGADDAEEE